MKKNEWFSAWFDSPYYHILYKNHDEWEAQTALDNLLHGLQLAPGARILDLACGKGRHARYLAEKGFDVTGLDISASSIAYARQSEHERLNFYQHDMRRPFRNNYFDAVVNFFTSFGYFEHDRDHLKTLINVCRGLKPGGKFLLDYFNAEWVRSHLVRSEEKTVDNITFRIRKHIRDGYVYKTVSFQTSNGKFAFREKVRLFTLEDFRNLFDKAGLHLLQTHGGYDLEDFHAQTSRRLILIAEKKA